MSMTYQQREEWGHPSVADDHLRRQGYTGDGRGGYKPPDGRTPSQRDYDAMDVIRRDRY